MVYGAPNFAPRAPALIFIIFICYLLFIIICSKILVVSLKKTMYQHPKRKQRMNYSIICCSLIILLNCCKDVIAFSPISQLTKSISPRKGREKKDKKPSRWPIIYFDDDCNYFPLAPQLWGQIEKEDTGPVMREANNIREMTGNPFTKEQTEQQREIQKIHEEGQEYEFDSLDDMLTNARNRQMVLLPYRIQAISSKPIIVINKKIPNRSESLSLNLTFGECMLISVAFYLGSVGFCVGYVFGKGTKGLLKSDNPIILVELWTVVFAVGIDIAWNNMFS